MSYRHLRFMQRPIVFIATTAIKRKTRIGNMCATHAAGPFVTGVLVEKRANTTNLIAISARHARMAIISGLFTPTQVGREDDFKDRPRLNIKDINSL